MALESLPKISPANFSPDNDLIQVYSKKGDYVGVINPSYIKSSPSGVSGAIQFSDGSAFASSSNLTWNNATNALGLGSGTTSAFIDFASNPAGSTSIVGAIRTYVDGVNLSEIMTFREDGNIGIGTTSPTAKLNIVDNVGGTGNALLISHPSAPATLSYNPTASALTLSKGYSYLAINTYGGGLNALTLGSGGPHGYLDLKENGTTYVSLSGTSTGNAGYSYFLSQLGVGTATTLGAKMNIKGSGSTNATTSLLVQNSSGINLLQQKDNGDLLIGTTASGLGRMYVPHDSAYGDRVFLAIQNGSSLFSTRSNAELLINGSRFWGGSLTLTANDSGVTGLVSNQTNATSVVLSGAINSYNGTSQNDACSLVYIQNRGATLQAAGSINWIKMDGNVYEAGGGGNKWCTGIYYNPSFTGGTLLANSHYCYHATSGQMMVNTASPNASAQLQVDSTTRGFLPPRMTDAQIRAIVSPANGLVAYNTDINHLCCYQNGAWAKFSHSPM